LYDSINILLRDWGWLVALWCIVLWLLRSQRKNSVEREEKEERRIKNLIEYEQYYGGSDGDKLSKIIAELSIMRLNARIHYEHYDMFGLFLFVICFLLVVLIIRIT
jgi:cbb3-type cytochrome oxidase subunit 3